MLKCKKLQKLGFKTTKKCRPKSPVRALSYYGDCKLNLQILKAHYHRIRSSYIKRIVVNSKEKVNLQNYLVSRLESRLDSVIFRSGLTRSHAHASQIISHGHVKINGRKVNIRSYQLRPNDIVSVDESLNLFKDGGNDYMEVNKNSIKLIRNPNLEDIPFSVSIDLDKAISFLKRH